MNTPTRFRSLPLRRIVGAATSVALAGTLVACAAANDTTAGSSASSTESSSSSASAASSAATVLDDSVTAAVSEAAAAFVATLDEDQLDQLSYDYTDEDAKTVWSNLPVSTGSSGGSGPGGAGTERNGVQLGDMTEEQRAAALAVVEAMLSEQGYQQVLEVMAADDALNEDNGGNSMWSSDLYSIAFFGDPTTDDTFYIQFGGHHLAINVDFQGDAVTISPEFVGIEPQSYESEDGSTVEAMSGEKSTVFALLGSLSDDQLAESELSQIYDDVVMGAGPTARSTRTTPGSSSPACPRNNRTW